MRAVDNFNFECRRNTFRLIYFIHTMFRVRTKAVNCWSGYVTNVVYEDLVIFFSKDFYWKYRMHVKH